MEDLLNEHLDIRMGKGKTDIVDDSAEIKLWQTDTYLRMKSILAKKWKAAQPCPNKHMSPFQHECRFTIEEQLKTLEEEKKKYGF